MIAFKDWEIRAAGAIIARQYDNLSRTLVVAGDIPEGWDWAMLVECQGNQDIIPLHPSEDNCHTCISAVLTENNLSLEGNYMMQLRGISQKDGLTKRHTNIITTFIPKSLIGYGQWPRVPTEFSEIERNVLAAEKRAEEQANLASQHAQDAAEHKEGAETAENAAKEAADEALENAQKSENARDASEEAQRKSEEAQNGAEESEKKSGENAAAAEESAKRAEEAAKRAEDVSGLPEGGSAGQVLKKLSDADGDAGWGNIATADEALVVAAETGLVDPAADGDNAVFTDENGNVFIF